MKIIGRLLLLVLLLLVFFYAVGRWQASFQGAGITLLPIGADPASHPSPGRALHLASYNIAHGRGADYGQSNWAGSAQEKLMRLRSIGEYLKKSGADIVVLNEVDFDAAWSGGVDQALVIAAAGAYPYVAWQLNYKVNIPFASLAFGNAVLSRHPIESAERITFTPLKWYEAQFLGNHDALQVSIDVGGHAITLWALHLEYRDEAIRIQAVQDILQEGGSGAFLMGDLNSRPLLSDTETAFARLYATGQFTTVPASKGRQFTFPTKKPDRAIDWIMVPAGWQLQSGWVGTFDQSDHLPVHAVVEPVRP